MSETERFYVDGEGHLRDRTHDLISPWHYARHLNAAEAALEQERRLREENAAKLTNLRETVAGVAEELETAWRSAAIINLDTSEAKG